MCNAVATVLACVLANWLIRKEGFFFVRPSIRLVRFVFLYSGQFFLSRVFLQASSSISVLVLSFNVTPAQLGLYGASDKLLTAFKSLVGPFSQALYPYMANTGNAKLLVRLSVFIGVALFIPASIGYYFSEEILIIIFGQEFAESSSILRMFIITGFFSFFSILYGYPAFAAIKRVDLANKSVIYGGVAQVVMLVMMSVFDLISTINVALTVLASSSLILLIRIYWFRKYKI
jgi:PST family polysaccharide transporter